MKMSVLMVLFKLWGVLTGHYTTMCIAPSLAGYAHLLYKVLDELIRTRLQDLLKYSYIYKLKLQVPEM